jgi:hypothetical protein
MAKGHTKQQLRSQTNLNKQRVNFWKTFLPQDFRKNIISFTVLQYLPREY